MRLTLLALGTATALLMGCGTGGRAAYYLQDVGPGGHPFSPRAPARQRATQTHQAIQGAVDDVARSTKDIASSLRQLSNAKEGLSSRANGVFAHHAVYGSNQLRWINAGLGGVTTLADAAVAVSDAEMELSILRMTGPRLQAAMFGGILLAAWVDFLELTHVVLRQCPAYSVERLVRDMHRVQRLIEPTLAALASQDPEQVEAASTAMPVLMGQLTVEFGSIREGARTAMENSRKLMAAVQFLEMLTLVSTLKVSLPRLPPAAPATLGVGLVMGAGGVMAGSRVVVSAEWVEMVRRLVRAGVISVPAVSSAVRIQAGQVMMAQAHRDLPQGVRDALGDGPEVRAMRETGRAGAGMSEAPKHHVLPEEHRAWFEQRGFTGDLNIDQFCVRLEVAHHQAIHGGGDWRLGRIWPGEWNQMVMRTLTRSEREAGRMLTRNEILDIVANRMKFYEIPMNFTPGRRR